jgi:hypothetical protein
VCSAEKRRVCSAEEAQCPPECCGQAMKRTPRGATSRVVESLDNGVMTKRLERLADAERLFRERAKATKKMQQE